MRSVKIAITIDHQLLKRLDGLVEQNKFPNRSQAVQEAIRAKIDLLRGEVLAEVVSILRFLPCETSLLSAR